MRLKRVKVVHCRKTQKFRKQGLDCIGLDNEALITYTYQANVCMQFGRCIFAYILLDPRSPFFINVRYIMCMLAVIYYS